MRFRFLIGFLLITAIACAQGPGASDVAAFVTVDAPVFVLNHVRVIDGTGAAPKEDQAVVIADGKINPSAPRRRCRSPGSATAGAIRLYRYSWPGRDAQSPLLHRFVLGAAWGRQTRQSLDSFIAQVPYTAPRLYLAAGVTTMRTTGSVEPYTDLKVMQRINANLMPGPAIDVTAPYLKALPRDLPRCTS